MAEKEYIERDKVLALKQKIGAYGMDISSEEVKEIPAADVAPVVHGEWVVEEERTGNYSHCSRCGIRCQGYAPNYKFCPNCGAKMDGKEATP